MRVAEAAIEQKPKAPVIAFDQPLAVTSHDRDPPPSTHVGDGSRSAPAIAHGGRDACAPSVPPCLKSLRETAAAAGPAYLVARKGDSARAQPIAFYGVK
jgi:hypothetical protein